MPKNVASGLRPRNQHDRRRDPRHKTFRRCGTGFRDWSELTRKCLIRPYGDYVKAPLLAVNEDVGVTVIGAVGDNLTNRKRRGIPRPTRRKGNFNTTGSGL